MRSPNERYNKEYIKPVTYTNGVGLLVHEEDDKMSYDYEYNTMNQLSKEIHTVKGKEDHKRIYTYRYLNKSCRKKFTQLGVNERILPEIEDVQELDNDGRVIKETSYVKGKVVGACSFGYVNDDLIVARTEKIRPDDTRRIVTKYYAYDYRHRLTGCKTVTKFNPDTGSITDTYEYYHNGVVSKYTTEVQLDGRTWKRITSYDITGAPIKIEEGDYVK